ncbi:MAG: hypothetical protein Q8R89_02600, partial [Desulfomicrobium sp.]|nr:hypothetical protein [Desulfomicrobium sp.]
PLLGAKASHPPGDVVRGQGRPRLIPRREKAFHEAFMQGRLLCHGDKQMIRNRHGLSDPLRRIKINL